jgi:hypothetical protein
MPLTWTAVLLLALGVTPFTTACGASRAQAAPELASTPAPTPPAPTPPAPASTPAPTPPVDSPPPAGGEAPAGDAAPTPARIANVPPIGALRFVDENRKEINVGVLVVGGGAAAFLTGVHDRNASIGLEGRVDASVPGGPFFTYLPLAMGEIRGYRLQLHLYGLEGDARLFPPIAEMASRARAVVIVERRAGDSDEVARIVAKKLSRPEIPVALVGAEGLAKQWGALGGPAPVFAGAVEESSYVPALKSVAKIALHELRTYRP